MSLHLVPPQAAAEPGPTPLTFVASGVASMARDVESVAWQLEREGFGSLAAKLYHSALQGAGLAAEIERHAGAQVQERAGK